MPRISGKAKARGKALAAGKAKAKAFAAERLAHNRRRDQCRAAVRELNAFAAQVGANPVPAKSASAEQVEGLVRVLQRRMVSAEQAARLRATTETWLRHGGRFSVPLEDAAGS